MLKKESLRTFIYREAGDEFESRVSLLKHLAARIRVYGRISVDANFEVFNEAAYEDVPPVQYTEAWLHPNGNFTPDTVWCLDDSEALKCYAVLAFDEKNPNATVYPQIKLIAVHLRQMLADELDKVDFDGIIRHAYILDEHKAKWNAAKDDYLALNNPDAVVDNRKKWTLKKLAELKAYRDAHTMQQTADKFGITQQRIRQLLPTKKLEQKGYSAFTYRTT